MRKNHSILLRFMASAALAAVLLTSCAGGATTYEKQMELGRKYLTEMNYAEAIAAFTEAIKLNPDDIEAYMARAEAYAALKKYDEATADYTAVIEKTDDQPYLQATAYIGRAGVGESTAALTDAESDYAAALTLLERDTDEQDADAILTLKKDVLVKHAAVCITLALLDKAADDYDALEQLGENVAAKRKELESLLPDTGTSSDAENGLTPDAPDADTPADAGTEPEAPAEEQPASSKDEPAASSKEEQPASSKEEAASSKQETQPAQQTGQKETFQYPHMEGESGTVTYQVGSTTITAKHRISWDSGTQLNWDDTYTLSKPVTSVEHPDKTSTLFHVPADTVITLQCKASGIELEYTGNVLADGTSEMVLTPYAYDYNEFMWGNVHAARELEDIWGVGSVDMGTSMTVKKDGLIYVIADVTEGDNIYRYPTIAFVAD